MQVPYGSLFYGVKGDWMSLVATVSIELGTEDRIAFRIGNL